jgi:hypothetical protein
MSIEELTAALARHRPIEVVAHAGGETHTVKVPANRKKWSAVIGVLAKLQWERVVLRGKGGDVLAILEDEPEAEAPASIDRDERLLKVLISAQREVLTYRDKDNSAALTACIAMLNKMGDAVTMLTKVHEMQLQAVASLAAPAEEGEATGLESMKMLMQMAPMMLSKFMAPPPVAAPKNAKNANAAPTPKNGAGG